MMRNYAGDASKTQLAKEKPRFVDPRGLMPLNKHHSGSTQNLSGIVLTDFKQSINRNHPVIWLSPLDGFPNRALTITGYAKHKFYLNDPWHVKRNNM